MFTPCTQKRGAQAEVYSQDMEHLAAILAFLGKPTLFVNPPGIVDTTQGQNWRTGPTLAAANARSHTYLDAADVLRQKYQGRVDLYTSWMPCDPWDIASNRCMYGLAGIREADMVHLQASGQHRYSVRIANAL